MYLQDVYNWKNVVLQITTFKKQLVKTKSFFALLNYWKQPYL